MTLTTLVHYPYPLPSLSLVLSLIRVRWELIQEEKKIMKELESGKANDALDTRLGEVRLVVV